MYRVNIVIANDYGELVDTQRKFDTLDEVRFVDINKLVNEAEDYARETNILEEELECGCPWCRHNMKK